MNTYETICSRRSIRAFENKPVAYKSLEKFANAGRLAPQAANRQSLEFLVIDDAGLIPEIFENVKLAGYLDWKPTRDDMPRAYILIVANTEKQKAHWIPVDAAIAAENICLAAWEDGIGSCMIASFNKPKVSCCCDLPSNYEAVLLIALGHPAHRSFAEEKDGAEYWRDDNGDFHVPKRPLKNILHRNRF